MSLGPLMIDVAGCALSPADRTLLREPAVGGVILFARNFDNPAQVRELIRDIRALRSPELLIAVDQEGGRVQRFREGLTVLPPMRNLGRTFDADATRARELARTTGWLLGAELAALGVDFSFTPVLDLDRGVSEVIGDRAFHSDPEAVGVLATELVRGLREAGVSAIGKHFPGHGAVVADSHHELPVDRRELADLGPDLLPYDRLIANGLAGVMTAHVVYSECDSLPATFSQWWLSEYLRKRLRFHGVIFSDDLSMAAARSYGSVSDTVRMALDAGCDMILICNDRPAAEQAVADFADYRDPPAMIRLASLRADVEASSADPASSERWRKARAAIDELTAPPVLTLDA